MTYDNWVNLVIGIGGVIVGLLSSRWVNAVNMKRLPSQNRKDDMEASETAVELFNKAIARQGELETELATMKQFMRRNRYRATLEFEDGPALLNVDPVLMIARLERIAPDEVKAGP